MNQSIIGILWMVITTILFVGVTATVRYLEGDVPAPQAAFLRYAIGTLMLAPSLISLSKIKPDRPLLNKFILRGFVHSIGVTLWFYAMSVMPVAEVTAIGFLTYIFVSLGASIFLKEKLHKHRLSAILISFVGALIILRPGFKVIESGQLGMLIATMVFTASYLIAKIVSKERSSSEIVAMLSIFTTIFLIPSAIYSWEPLSLEAFLILAFTALIATLGHITMTKAIKAAPMVVTQPILFLQLVWASMVGLFIFDEKFDLFVILGGTIIMLCVCYVSYREHKLGKKITSEALQKVI
ncbi:DMT family transporter [Alphaproteobacteria bacterium]|nr:DMT family transporter [Alphaproteobacteria bacterium]MDA9165210.1 DMT family transporter [Alphaproteobacteria bacterium]MDA9806714.1 DMT family transporter [Alphaproteobacteria bacterium]MDB2583322.1 DMT family transporter [Alphaproteobacteria bacterium]MDB2683970.1 DMT family transporter [Alphaproteobacteria bacterium]